MCGEADLCIRGPAVDGAEGGEDTGLVGAAVSGKAKI